MFSVKNYLESLAKLLSSNKIENQNDDENDKDLSPVLINGVQIDEPSKKRVTISIYKPQSGIYEGSNGKKVQFS